MQALVASVHYDTLLAVVDGARAGMFSNDQVEEFQGSLNSGMHWLLLQTMLTQIHFLVEDRLGLARVDTIGKKAQHNMQQATVCKQQLHQRRIDCHRYCNVQSSIAC